MSMQLVEQHVIKRTDSRYEAIDRAAFASKNLYNAALYEMRQAFIFGGKRLRYEELYHRMKSHPAYKALPAKGAQQVLKLLDKNWTAWEEALKEWEVHPEKFLGRPCLPKYKDKQKGRNILIYTIQAIAAPALREGRIVPSGLPIVVNTAHTNVDQVRIVPRHGHYVVEVVYEREETQANVDPALIASVDIGVNNLVALTSNKVGFMPRLVNGRPLKSINQYYNKRHAELQGKLMKMDARRRTSNRIEQITNKRTRRIDHYLHTVSRRVIDLLVAEGIGTLIIGKNPNWKQEVNIGKRNNQNFVSIPHARFIHLLSYKAQLVGIQVILTEESYTLIF